jgi:carbonic anhydrase
MNEKSKTAVEKSHLDRRSFLNVPTVAAATGLVGGSLWSSGVYADALTKAQRDRLTPDEVLAELKRGNERFRKGETAKRDYLAEQKSSAKEQYPAAILLSCIDSRAPAEVIMDQGIGNVFNSRVAGNIVNEDILGSMEFACKVAGAKVILVLGHTACGAVKGAIDKVELGHLTGLLAKIRPAVQATACQGERSSKNLAFVDTVARKNVELTVAQILADSAVLRALHSERTIKVVGAMYSLETAVVDFFA